MPGDAAARPGGVGGSARGPEHARLGARAPLPRRGSARRLQCPDPGGVPLAGPAPGAAGQPMGCGFTGVSRQMSRLYSAMVRSEEKRPLCALLTMLIRTQASSFRYTAAARSWARR